VSKVRWTSVEQQPFDFGDGEVAEAAHTESEDGGEYGPALKYSPTCCGVRELMLEHTREPTAADVNYLLDNMDFHGGLVVYYGVRTVFKEFLTKECGFVEQTNFHNNNSGNNVYLLTRKV
jgi:hypothetical protein